MTELVPVFLALASLFVRVPLLTWGIVGASVFCAEWLLARGWDSHSKRAVRIVHDSSGVTLVEENGVRESLQDIESVTECIRPRRELWIERAGKRPLRIEMPDGLTRSELIDRLSMGALELRGRYSLGSVVSRWFLLLLVLLGLSFVLPAHIRHYVGVLWNLISVPFMLLTVVPTRVDVGLDGMALRWLFYRPYIAFADVVTLDSSPIDTHESQRTHLRINTKTGRAYRLYAPGGTSFVADVSERFRAYQRRRLQAEEAAVDAVEHPPWFRYPDEPSVAWVDRLRSPRTHGAYRSLPGDTEALLRLVCDPDASLIERAGAFLVACHTSTGLEAVRAQARSIVHPVLRSLADSISNKASTETIAQQLDQLPKTGRG
jgi:hypothetical protein